MAVRGEHAQALRKACAEHLHWHGLAKCCQVHGPLGFLDAGPGAHLYNAPCVTFSFLRRMNSLNLRSGIKAKPCAQPRLVPHPEACRVPIIVTCKVVLCNRWVLRHAVGPG